MSVFLLRRLHGFALIVDGIGHILNLRLGLGLRSAKALAKARHRAASVHEPTAEGPPL